MLDNIRADTSILDAEIWALRQAFNSHDDPGSSELTPLNVGSLKPNIGHLESASGAASLIKAILMLENDAMPPVINLKVLKDSCKGSDISVSSEVICQQSELC